MNKVFRRCLPIFLSVLLVFSVFQISCLSTYVNAESQAVVVWDGETKTKPEGSGSETSPYLIATAENLAWVVTNYPSKAMYYKLTADIYLNDIEKIDWSAGEVNDETYSPNSWFFYETTDATNHPNTARLFYGTIDGDGHTVYGLYYKGNYTSALIPGIEQANTTTIKNLGIEAAYVNASGKAGAFVGFSNGANNTLNVTNCFAKDNVTVSSAGKAGVIIASSGAKINVDKCYSMATVALTGNGRFGFIGDCWSGTRIISNTYIISSPITSSNAFSCTNVYATNTSGGTNAIKVVAENMQGTDALTTGSKMPLLAESGAFTATSGYPRLTMFLSDEEIFALNIWDGKSVSASLQGSGTEDDPYLIKNGSDLAYAVKTYMGTSKFYKLENDIFLNSPKNIEAYANGTLTDNTELNQWYYTTEGQGSTATTFYGTLDGAGHIVYGLFYEGEYSSALIPQIQQNLTTTVKNLGIEAAYIKSTGTNTKAGAFVACSRADKNTLNITNCYAGENVIIDSSARAGIIIASSAASINVDGFYSLATARGSEAGLIGNDWTSVTINNAYSSTKIVGNNPRCVTATNVYATNITNVSGAIQIEEANMQGADALTSANKMPSLAECVMFTATATYPKLKSFITETDKLTVVESPVLGKDYVYGDVKYDNNFESETVGNFPTGWEAGYNGNGTNFAWVGTNPSTTVKVVDSATYGKSLQFTVANADAFLALPEITSKNYIFEAEFVSTQYGAIGLANNMWGGLSNANGVMYTAMHPGESKDYNNDSIIDGGIYKYLGNGGARDTVFDLPAGCAANQNEIIKLKLVSFDGYSYFYYNDICVAKIPQRTGGGDSDWVGFYKCNGNALITDVKVTAISSVQDLDKNEWCTVEDSLTENEITVDSCDYLITANVADSGTVTSIALGDNIINLSNGALKLLSYKGNTYVWNDDVYKSVVKQTGVSKTDTITLIGATDVTIKTLIEPINGFDFDSTNVDFKDRAGSTNSAGITFNATIDTANASYVADAEFGFIVKIDGEIIDNSIISTTNEAGILKADVVINNTTATLSAKLVALSDAVKDSYIRIRPYMAVKNGEDTAYCYGEMVIVNPSNIAYDGIYSVTTDETVKANIKALYENVGKFKGVDSILKNLKFSVFADFHYKEDMYISSVEDLNQILEKASDNNVDFVMSEGDFCNDFTGSPELINAFINNPQNLSVYNIYGNHELETGGNTMANTTNSLTNDGNVVWGTDDGKVGDGYIGYYYFDKNGYRIISLDANYSYDSLTNEWVHYPDGSYKENDGTIYSASLGERQLTWFDSVLKDAAENGISCIVNSHVGFSEKWGSSPDSAAVRNLYNKYNSISKGTVILSLNGHLHTNHQEVVDGVLYFDVNTARNGLYYNYNQNVYEDTVTFQQVKYNANGTATEIIADKKVNELAGRTSMWYFTDPLSAIIEINKDGKITITGDTTTWYNNQEPPANILSGVDGAMPGITGGIFQNGVWMTNTSVAE